MSDECSSCSSNTCPSSQKSAEAIEQQKISDRLSKIKNTIIVLSGKGGVGKSTVSVNLASALSNMGLKVGLLDIDIHGPSVPKMLGMSNFPVEAVEGHITPVETPWGLKMMSIAFFLNTNDAVIWRGPLKMAVIKQFIRDVEWGELDYLLVDCPPGTGDEPLSIAQIIANPTGAVVVTTPQAVAIDAVKRSVTFCNQLKMPVLGIVENMSGYICPKCGEHSNVFGSDGGVNLAKSTNTELLATIPLSIEMVPAGDAGTPVALNQESPIGKIYTDIAVKINAKLS